jgi:hypothetical protein
MPFVKVIIVSNKKAKRKINGGGRNVKNEANSTNSRVCF